LQLFTENYAICMNRKIEITWSICANYAELSMVTTKQCNSSSDNNDSEHDNHRTINSLTETTYVNCLKGMIPLATYQVTHGEVILEHLHQQKTRWNKHITSMKANIS
jgi:hypothetical protein